MKKTLNIILLCLMLIPLQGLAQRVIKGVVRDSREPLIGATVFLQNQNKRIVVGTTTNTNGEYQFSIPQSYDMKGLSFVFSYVGYKSSVIKYTNQSVIDVKLDDDYARMDDVVVTGKRAPVSAIGISNKDMGAAYQKIDIGDLQDLPVLSVEDMLQGKLANVDIIAASGDPGSRMAIRIRGTNSLNASNEPLIVVDGIPFETEINSDFDFATATGEDLGALVSIAPTDIESIEVLKDASATAIWGPKAANGVLLIVTKKGVKGAPQFSISQKVSVSVEPRGIPMLDSKQYVTMIQDALWNKVQDRGFSHEGGIMDYLKNYQDIRFDPNYEHFDEFNCETDWLDLVTQNAINSETGFSMSGGGDRATYRFSAGYTSEVGTTIGTGLTRINTRLNVDYNFSKKLQVSSSFAYTEADRENTYRDNVRGQARDKMPNMSPYIMDDNGDPTSAYFTAPESSIQGGWKNRGIFNPVAMANDSRNNNTRRDMRVGFNLRYDILNGLVFAENIAFDLSSSKTSMFLPNTAIGVDWAHDDFNRGEETMSDDITISTSSTLTYEKRFAEKHKVVFTGLLQTRDYKYSVYGSSVSGLGAEEVADPSAGGRITGLNSGLAANRSVGGLLNGHYNYAERYMITAGVRLDGNSKMGKNRRWGYFPTVSAVWRISEEPFLKKLSWLNEAKFRGSWGISGRSPDGNYSYIGRFNANDSYIDQSAIKPQSVQLNNLKWETVDKYNVGFDIALLQHRVTLAVEYYQNTTKDLLQRDVAIPSSTGFSRIDYFNSGKVRNQGWEVMVDMRDIIKAGKFRLSLTNINISRNRNTVLELPSNMRYTANTDFDNGRYPQNVVEGNPLGSFYGYRSLGVYQNTEETYARDKEGNLMVDIYGNKVVTSMNGVRNVRPGDAKYEDLNGDGIINKYDVTYLGNSMPILTGGLTMNMSYGNLNLRASFQARIGQSVVNKARMNSESMYNANNQSQAVLKRWRYEGDMTDIPRALFGEGYNYLGSDRFVEKSSFLRMKDITVSYSFPKHLLEKISVNRLTLTFNVYDPLTWTNYKGQDPEVGIGSGMYQLSEDNSFTPRPRRFAVSMILDF